MLFLVNITTTWYTRINICYYYESELTNREREYARTRSLYDWVLIELSELNEPNFFYVLCCVLRCVLSVVASDIELDKNKKKYSWPTSIDLINNNKRNGTGSSQ